MGPPRPTPSFTQGDQEGEDGSVWPRKTERSALMNPLLCARHRGTGKKNPGVVPSWPELTEGEMDIISNLSNKKIGSESCVRTYMLGTSYM